MCFLRLTDLVLGLSWRVFFSKSAWGEMPWVCKNHCFPQEKQHFPALKRLQDGKVQKMSTQKTSEPTYDSFGPRFEFENELKIESTVMLKMSRFFNNF